MEAGLTCELTAPGAVPDREIQEAFKLQSTDDKHLVAYVGVSKFSGAPLARESRSEPPSWPR